MIIEKRRIVVGGGWRIKKYYGSVAAVRLTVRPTQRQRTRHGRLPRRELVYISRTM